MGRSSRGGYEGVCRKKVPCEWRGRNWGGQGLKHGPTQPSLGSGGVSIPGDTGENRTALGLSLEYRNQHSFLCLPILQPGTLLGPGWAVAGREPWQKQEGLQGSCQGKAKEDPGVAAASSLSSSTLQLQMLFKGSERDSPVAVSNSRLLGQQGPSQQGLSVVVLDLCAFLFAPQTPGFPGQSFDVFPLLGWQ